MATRADQLRDSLSRLRQIPNAEGAALVSRDGLVVAADLPKNIDRETFSAMLAAMLGAAETALIEIGRGMPDRVLLENKDTRILAAGITDQLMVVVVGRATMDANVARLAIGQVTDVVRAATA